MPEAAEVFNDLVDGIDYPMFIVTAAADDGTRAGCLVGFATQASIDPPRFLVLLSTQNETYEIAKRASTLVVHFLGEANRELAKLFGEQSGAWADKFAECEWRAGPGDVPVLSGVRGWFAGRVLQRFECGDHVAHLLEPIDGAASAGGLPLTFQQVRDLDAGHPA